MSEAEKQDTAINSNEKEESKKQCDWSYWIIRIIIIIVLVVVLAIAIIEREKVKEITVAFLEWLRDNPVVGPIILCLVYIVVVLFLIPGSLLTIGGALALQQAYQKTWLAVLVGSIAIWLGAWIGSNLAMLNGRYLFRE